jgi:hypothetical protein
MVPGQRAGSGKAAAGVRMLRPSAGWLEGGGGRVWEKVGREVKGGAGSWGAGFRWSRRPRLLEWKLKVRRHATGDGRNEG